MGKQMDMQGAEKDEQQQTYICQVKASFLTLAVDFMGLSWALVGH